MDKTDAGAISSSRQTQESSVRTQELCEKGVGPGLSFLSLLPPSLIIVIRFPWTYITVK